MKQVPLISIIILNWNGKEFLNSCIRSLREQTYPNMEIILVDNASTDGSVEYIRRQFPDLHVVVNPKNLGYGGGNNRGVQEAKGEYIFVLNSDTEIEKQCQRWSGEVHPEGSDRGLHLFFSFPF